MLTVAVQPRTLDTRLVGKHVGGTVACTFSVTDAEPPCEVEVDVLPGTAGLEAGAVQRGQRHQDRGWLHRDGHAVRRARANEQGCGGSRDH